MRFDVVFLLAVAASLVHLQSPSGVASLPMTHADGRKRVNENPKADSTKNNFETLIANREEERGYPPVGHSIEHIQASMSSLRAPKIENFNQPTGPNAWIEHNPIAELVWDPALSTNRIVEWGETLGLYETHHGAGNLADMLVKLMESQDKSMSQHADNLMQVLLQRWWQEGKSENDLFKSLELPVRNHISFGEAEYRKIKALSYYIRLLNDRTLSHISLIQTLMNHYDAAALSAALLKSWRSPGAQCADYALMLHGQMVNSWIENGLSADKVFAYLRLDKKGNPLFQSYEFKALEKYMVQLKPNHVLSGMTILFGGESKFAKRAVKEYTLTDSVTAGNYLFVLLVHWKMKKNITPDNLLERMFPLPEDQDECARQIRSFYRDIYDNDAFPKPKSSK